MAPLERFDTLVQSLDVNDKKETIGFFYVFWGVMNTLGVWIFTLVWPSVLFWVVWIPCGLIVMMVLVHGKVRRDGRMMLKGMTLPFLWIALMTVMPLLIWFFPEVLHLYSTDWIFSLTSAWVALGLFATGAHARRPSIAWGSLGFLGAALLYPLFPAEAPWVFTAANLFGMVIPGLASGYEETH